jgi:hypothetical protein
MFLGNGTIKRQGLAVGDTVVYPASVDSTRIVRRKYSSNTGGACQALRSHVPIRQYVQRACTDDAIFLLNWNVDLGTCRISCGSHQCHREQKVCSSLCSSIPMRTKYEQSAPETNANS